MPSASFLFLLFLYFRNLLLKIFSELEENLRGIFTRRKAPGHQRGAWGPTTGQGQPPALPPWTVGGTRPCSWWVPSAPSDAYKFTLNLKMTADHYFPEKSSRRAVISNPISGVILKQFPAPCQRGDRSRRALHRHAFLRDEL